MKPVPPQSFRGRLRRLLRLENAAPFVRRMMVGLIGGTILLIGMALIVLPGPAFVVIPVGLAILATEFVWARRWLIKGRGWFNHARRKFSRKRTDETGKPE